MNTPSPRAIDSVANTQRVGSDCQIFKRQGVLLGAAMVRVSGKRLFGWISMVLMFISFTRVLVLFLEAMATVSDERSQDSELLDLCKSGTARGSPKLRSACLQAQADRASPLVLKAVVRAVSTAWREFSESVATPFGFATMVLFILSSLLLPVVPWIKAILTAWAGDDEDLQDLHRDSDLEHHIVVLNGDQTFLPARANMRKRMARRLIGNPRRVASFQATNGDADSEVEAVYANGHGHGHGNSWVDGGVRFRSP